MPRDDPRVEQRSVFPEVSRHADTNLHTSSRQSERLAAQQAVAPTHGDRSARRAARIKGDYNITNSFEFGYRWSLVGGDLGEYRSDVNYRNGLRLLSSSFSMDSKDGHGRYFDQILLNTHRAGQRSVSIRHPARAEERPLPLRHDLAARTTTTIPA